MGRLVLIALLAGCYDPTVADCVDTCAADQLCPDGLTCDSQGFCRIAGAAGMCTSGSGSGSGSGCPIAPMGRGTPECTTAMPINATAPDCLVSCAPAASGSAVLGFSGVGSWHAAKIASSTAETTAKTLATTPTWIGLHAPNGMGSNPAAWTWTNGTPATYADWGPNQPVDNGSAGNCAAIGAGGWMSEPCTNTHGFLIDPNP
jgi:hypothetical protein